MDGEDKEEEFNLPSASIESEDHSDVDPFEELGVGSRINTTSTGKNENSGYDALADLVDDDDEGATDVQGIHFSNKQEMAEELEGELPDSEMTRKAEATYVMLLQTVWVDGILDPAEVRLLSKKRSELEISFKRHLELVDDLLG